MEMLQCLMDISVPEDSKCTKCCIYCDEKEVCKYRCLGVDEWVTEENISKNCVECMEL